MRNRPLYLWVAALLLAPLTSSAQTPGGAAAPAVAPGAPAAHDPAEDLELWFPEHGHGDGFLDGPGAWGLHRRMAMRFAMLDLTDAQRQRLRDLHEAEARKSIQRRADMELARMDLHKLMGAENVDKAAVNTQIDKLARLQTEAMKSRVDSYLQARAVLTPEQLKQLRSGPGPGQHPRRPPGDDVH